jgi:predicted RND superfamily exporter protein
VSNAIADFIWRWRRVLTAIIVFGAVAFSPRANITKIDNDLTAWFSVKDPVYRDYARFRDEFGGTRTLIIAIEAPSRDALISRDGLQLIETLTNDIEKVQTVQRVSSLSTATVIDLLPPSADDDGGLDVRRLFKDLGTKTPEEVGARAIRDDLLRGDLISSDGTVAAIVVFFDEAKIDAARGRVLAEIEALVAAKTPPGFRAHMNGSLEITEAYNRVTLANQRVFTPPIFVVTMLAIFLLFRSWKKTVLTLVAVLISVLWSLGLYSVMGFSFNVLSSMLVPLIVVLAIADDVHILQHFDYERRHGTVEAAFKSTVANLFAPLLGASGTTALGMLSLCTTNIVAVRQFGFGAAVGIMVDFALSIVLVPTLLVWLNEVTAAPPQETWFSAPMRKIGRFSSRNPWRVMVVATVVTVAAGAGLTKLHVDTNHINFFAKSHPLSTSAAVIDTKLAGIYNFQVLLEGAPDAIKQPDTLERMDRFSRELEQLPYVRKVTSIVEYVKRVDRELNGGEQGSGSRAGGVPDNAAAVAQELFVFGLADEGRVELERVAASDFSKAQITVKLASMSSDLVFGEIRIAERRANEIFAGSLVKPTVTGSGRLFSTLDHYLVVSQISSFATAFVTVFAVIFLIFRSWRFGLLAIIPNLFPVLAVFGVMGWANISLNVATIMLASVALGVVDDDTIHFISRFRRDTAGGMSSEDAIEEATAHEGRASLTTAVINSMAFGVLAFSEYKPTAWFGGLLGLTMLVAFLAEIFILPATIMLLPGLFGADAVHAKRRRRARGLSA